MYSREYGDGSPHLLVRWDRGQTCWALFVTYEGVSVPGLSWMAVHQFDVDWKQISVDRFPTGYRIALFDVWQERVEALSESLVVVRLGSIGSFGNFSYRQRQYYTLRAGRVVFVRIEEENKDLERGIFCSERPMTGPVPIKRTADEWIASLSSSDPALVLETLTWLGGAHMSSAEPRHENVNQESIHNSRLWEAVRDDPRTKRQLDECMQSKNGWMRAAAVLAARHD